MTETRSQRLPAAERRELMLDAASIVFGERGYAGTTTDAVAAAAGVSQAYIVRTFGSKEALFAETASRAVSRIKAVFRQAAASESAAEESVEERLGRAYVDLVADRGILLTVMHLLTLGHHDKFGPLAREGFLSIYRVLRDEVGLTPQEAEAFLAKGMLINTMLGLRLPDIATAQADAGELLTCVLEGATDEVVALSTKYQPLGQAIRRGD